MKRLEMMSKLKGYAVFTAMDVERILGKTRGYAYLYIQRLKKENLIREVEKGRYTCQQDPLLIASRIVWPSYVSGWAALQFHHLTEQLPTTIEVITTRSRKRRRTEFMGTGIEFSRVSTTRFFGYDKIIYQKHPVFMAEGEKALLDALFLRHLSPAEFTDILKAHKRDVSIRRLKGYARKMSGSFSSMVERLVSG